MENNDHQDGIAARLRRLEAANAPRVSIDYADYRRIMLALQDAQNILGRIGEAGATRFRSNISGSSAREVADEILNILTSEK
jgi:hypothetical protein